MKDFIYCVIGAIGCTVLVMTAAEWSSGCRETGGRYMNTEQGMTCVGGK